jgi:Zn2+/Cd2+-exporting ATPase
MDAATAPVAAMLCYRVGGMDCPSCAGKVETALNRLGGTDGVRLNYQTALLVLRLNEAMTPRETIEVTVRGLGFDIRPVGPIPVVASDATSRPGDASKAAPAWWSAAKPRLLLAISTLLLLGTFADWAVPGLRSWGAVPAALLGLGYFGRQALRLARAGSPFSIEMLMSIATLGAILIGAPSEASVVVLLFTAGEIVEGVAAGRARAGIQALSALAPRTALLIEEQGAREVPAESLQVGQLVLVRPGDKVPSDGVVVEGASALDESPVTGESIPVPKKAGDTLVAGSINRCSALQLRVTHTAADNTVARIVHMVEEAQANRAPIERFIERFSARYTPAVVAIAALTAILPPLLFGAAWLTWIYRSLALLLIGCPCALVLSTPSAITSGIAAGARRGLLIKGGAALETIGHVKAIAFDKTGTLTEGKPHVTDVLTLSGTERSIIGVAASVEQGSTHPIAHAILARAQADGIPMRPVAMATAIPGHAVAARVSGRLITVGSPTYVAQGTDLAVDITARIAALEDAGKTVVLVASGSEVLGAVAVQDEPRADAVPGVNALRALGIRPVMLTGDNRRAGEAVGKMLGIEVKSQLLPDAKLKEIEALQQAGAVAMVGDGINDAPALAAASVGIAMGSGTDVALETADAAVLGNQVGEVAALVRLSRATMRNIRQNVAVALGLKAVILVTTLAGLTGLWPAILSDTGATVLVTLNALRLLRHQPN